MTTELTPGSAAQLAANTLLSQVNALAELTSGAVRSQLETLAAMIESNAAMIIEASNAQVDQINDLIDELERRDSAEIGGKKVEAELRQVIESLKAQLAQQATEHMEAIQAEQSEKLDAQSLVAKLEAKLISARATETRITRELHDLKQLDPAGTKKRLQSKQAELDTLRKTVADMRSQILKLKTKSVSDDKKIAELCSVIEQAQGEIDRYQRQDKYKALWKKHLDAEFHNTTTDKRWYAYVYPDGLAAYGEVLRLDFKLWLLNSDGLACNVMVTEWLEPVIAKADFTCHVPGVLVDAIKRFLADALDDQEQLFARKHHFQEVSVRELPGIQGKYLDALEEANIKTVADVMVSGQDRIENVKGLGKKTAYQIHSTAADMVKAWEKQQQEQAA